ncbi:MAG: L,D-transpeptidase family protein [Flavobacteriales bacterium]|nr:L,D-transpeptidase family protein [Flavobacteriales bacterium]
MSSGFYFNLILFVSIIIIYSCVQHPVPDSRNDIDLSSIDSIAIRAKIQHEQDSSLLAFFLQENITDITRDGTGDVMNESLSSTAILPELYDSYAYQLLWADSTDRSHAIMALSDAEKDGLVPDDYHLNSILELIDQDLSDFELKAGLDVLITDGIILYGTHLLNGRTDPNTLEPTLKFEPRSFSADLLDSLRASLHTGDVQTIIGFLRPPSHYYSSMMLALEKYKSLENSGGWHVVSISQRKLEPSKSYPEIPSIRRRMKIEGDLLESEDVEMKDSLRDSTIYDITLKGAIERFQSRHGLNPDGIIGRGTVQAMNISVQEKIDLLKINMERARWIHHDLDSNYVLVNIAGFDLRLVKGDTLCWTTKVMVGKIATATPVFKDDMQYIEINPFWTVPFSISNGEILPKLKKDRTYLKRNNMQILSMTGKEKVASEIDFNDFENEMPFIVRQGPGSNNSLGRIKFLFPNRFRVYLHDTPSKSLFAREERAFSHGCIRVENPFQLATYLLHDQGITSSYLDSVSTTGKNLRIDLERTFPVLITYSTAFADNDQVYFFRDVYNRDKPLREAMGL